MNNADYLVLLEERIKKNLEKVRNLSPNDNEAVAIMSEVRKDIECWNGLKKQSDQVELEREKIQINKEESEKGRKSDMTRMIIEALLHIGAAGVAITFMSYLELTGKMLTGGVLKEMIKKTITKIVR